MKIEFDKMIDEMNDKNKGIYKLFLKFFKSDLPETIKIDKTYDSKSEKKSENSYCFVSEGCKCKTLINAFGIENGELFCQKYDMAISGSGEEARRILTLHSSSLCALLHFYDVTEKNPLTLKLNTNNGERIVKYTQSVFEYKSPVINNPSNMDIVLIGKDTESEENIVLFLESKFSEYYLNQGKKSNRISTAYLNKEYKYSETIYNNKRFLKSMNLKISNNNDNTFNLEFEHETEKPFYIDGIKQMISHYVGIRNILVGDYFKDWDTELNQKIVNDAIKDNNAIIVLGEILFDNFEDNEIEDSRSRYNEKYKKLAEGIVDQIEKDKVKNFEILEKNLEYSLFKNNEIDHKICDKVKKFYNYGKVSHK